MPKISGPQLIIKLTEDILSAQYCQYIYAAVEENLLHEKLQEGFTGFVNDVSNEPSERLPAVDLVHTEIVCLLDLMFSLRQSASKEIFVDCIHYLKTLETIIPNMASRIFHIAFHLNQYLSEEKKIVNSEEVMNLMTKIGYPQRPIDFDNLENCVECHLHNQLDQSMFILLKMANEIPTPSFSWVFEKENCKIFLQEVKRLYSFRRTFESASSFLEHNYSFLQANSNQLQNNSILRRSNSELVENSKKQTMFKELFANRPNLFKQTENCTEHTKPRRKDHGRRNSISCYPITKKKEDNWRRKSLDFNYQFPFDDVSDCFNTQDIFTQTDFTEDSDDEDFQTAPNSISNSVVGENDNVHIEDEMLELSECSDVEVEPSVRIRAQNTCTQTDFVEKENDYVAYDGDHSYSSLVNCSRVLSKSKLEKCEALELSECSDVEIGYSEHTDVLLERLEGNAGPALITDSEQAGNVANHEVCESIVEIPAATVNAQVPLGDSIKSCTESPTKTPDHKTGSLKRRPPKRMLIVYVERLNLDHWLSKHPSALPELESDAEVTTDENNSDNDSDHLPENTENIADSVAFDSQSVDQHSAAENGLPSLPAECNSEVERQRKLSGSSVLSAFTKEGDTSQPMTNSCLQDDSEKNTGDLNEIADPDVVVIETPAVDDMNVELSTKPAEEPDPPDKGDGSGGSTDASPAKSNHEKEHAETSPLVVPRRLRHSSEIVTENVSPGIRTRRSKSSDTEAQNTSIERQTSPRHRKSSVSPIRRGDFETSDESIKSGTKGRRSLDLSARNSSSYSLRKRKHSMERPEKELSSGSEAETVARVTRSHVKDIRAGYRTEGSPLRLRSNRLSPSQVVLRKALHGSKTNTHRESNCDKEGNGKFRKQTLSDIRETHTENSSDSYENYFNLPAKRCRPLQNEAQSEESSPSMCGRLSSSSSCGSGSVDHIPRTRHKLYTGAADKIMAISRRRLNEDSVLLDSEIKSGPKAQRSFRTLPVPSDQR